MKVIDPATGRLLREIPEHSPDEVERRLAAAATAFLAWRGRPLAERADFLRAMARALREDAARHAALMVEEMGKPIGAAEAEVEKCAWVCDFYAENAGGFLAEEQISTDARESVVRYEPLGAVLAVMPWNFPYWQVFRAVAPALAAGNVLLLKHASNVAGCALAIEEVGEAAALPEGVLTTLLVGSDRVAGLIADPRVRAVTLTGSDGAGREVAAAAGRALKKTVLELGGSDPFVVLADADPVAAARSAAQARTINSGQSCIAAKRFVVEAAIADRFVAALVEAMEGLAVGDPADRGTAVGPLARRDLVEDLHDQVERSVAAGAELRTGGVPLERDGFFYPPTVLDRVRPGMAAFDEETFGPVAAVVRAADAEEAIRLANTSRFGLGASLWTADAGRGRELASRLEAGAVFVNGIVKSDPRLPFGGIKDSGYGRELGVAGIREFVNVKTVWVAP